MDKMALSNQTKTLETVWILNVPQMSVYEGLVPREALQGGGGGNVKR